jgi:hypothetical protein
MERSMFETGRPFQILRPHKIYSLPHNGGVAKNLATDWATD